LSPRTVAPETFVGPTGLQTRLFALIDGAQDSIDVAMYLFTVTALADRLIAAKNRGVAVRVLFDPDHEGNASVRTRLTSAGVMNRNSPPLYSFSHAKYLVIDGAAAVIMSMNFNGDALTNERNYGMITRDSDDVADTQAIFDMDWAAGGGEPLQPADLACTRLVVSPNNAKVRLLELIDGATQTLDVEAMYVADDTIRAAIGAAKQRGVTVRVILETGTDNAETRAYFTGLGIPVHAPGDFFLHAKLLIADGVVFVGSENFSLTALTKNREVGALVFEPAPAAVIQQQFDADWAATN
jgi:phosphatidylserine/phosphatidylglycerophosphate/cardiolipin synthase-like enzyme